METIDILLDRQEEPLAQPACPICAGPLVPLRDFCRCMRCQHIFCDACEGESETEA